MAIIRVLAINPAPKHAHDDIIIFQVPENSPAHKLLTSLLDNADIEHVAVEFPRKVKAKDTQP